MPPDEITTTAEQTAGETSTTPAAGAAASTTPASSSTPSPSEEVKKALETAQRIAADSSKERETYLRTIQALMAPSQQETPPAEETLPEVDEPISKFVDAKLNRALGGFAAELKKTYDKGRADDFAYRAEIEEDRAASRHGLDDERSTVRRSEIRDYLSQLPVEYRGNSKIVDEAYYAVLGRKTDEARKIESRRAADLATSTRSSSDSPSSRFTPEEQAFVQQRINPSITAADMTVLSGKTVSMEDYLKTRKKA